MYMLAVVGFQGRAELAQQPTASRTSSSVSTKIAAAFNQGLSTLGGKLGEDLHTQFAAHVAPYMSIEKPVDRCALV